MGGGGKSRCHCRGAVASPNTTNPSNGNRIMVEGVGWTEGAGGGSVVTFGAPVEGNRSLKAVVAGARR
jgi:hypothetical protein